MAGRRQGHLALMEEPASRRLRFGERWARARGYEVICGLDEVGRGPLAGPVVAAAVILPRALEDVLIEAGLDDSKRLTERRREALAERIRAEARYGIGEVSARDIDQMNILRASHEAMRRALAALLAVSRGPRPECLLIDGTACLEPSPLPQVVQKAIVKGDGRSVAIAAASVVAKVHRDQLMVRLDARYPGYDLARNKGYPTRAHREALRKRGPSPIHRRSFRGVVLEAVGVP